MVPHFDRTPSKLAARAVADTSSAVPVPQESVVQAACASRNTRLTGLSVVEILVFCVALGSVIALTVAHYAPTQAPTPLMAPRTDPPRERVVQANQRVDLRNGYDYLLTAGSVWRAVGSLPQGEVYEAQSAVARLKERGSKDAWLVIRDDTVVGLYLPAEQRYAPLTAPVMLAPSKRRP